VKNSRAIRHFNRIFVPLHGMYLGTKTMDERLIKLEQDIENIKTEDEEY
jgi:hypothetical protein